MSLKYACYKNTFFQFVKFLVVGCINTVSSLIVIYTLMLMGVGLVASNAVGYLFGLMLSFVINSACTFNIGVQKKLVFKYIVAFAVSYGLNISVVFSVHAMGGSKAVSQLSGMPFYTIIFFILNKWWVIK